MKNIELKGVRQNNLKNLQVCFPHKKLTVITGLSGSGKSSLAFDTLYAEGQRRYIESLSTYTRQFLEKMPKPEVEIVKNIPPSIALEQRNTVVHSRSIVGTQTEVVDYLRVLFSKIGKTYCTESGELVEKIDAQRILKFALSWLPQKKAALIAPIPIRERKHLESFLKIILEQGFRRVLIQPKRGKSEVLNLEETEFKTVGAHLLKSKSPNELWVVVDRIRMKKKPDSQDRTRILDSIEQALDLGQKRVIFYDLETSKWKMLKTEFACLTSGKVYPEPEPNLFSFNSPLGACDHCSGFGYNLELDEARVVPHPEKTLKDGAIDPLSKPSLAEWESDLFRFAEKNRISIGKRYNELTDSQKNLLWEGSKKDKTFPGIKRCFEILAKKKYKLHVRVFIRRYQSQTLCPVCQGTRLNENALAVKIKGTHIGTVLKMTIHEALEWVQGLKLPKSDKKIAQEVMDQIQRRLSLLDLVGVGYLHLSRQTKTLSGGEFQRINLATQLGSGLCGTLYVLDEPSIGLHASDTQRLLSILEQLRDQGNTLVVVEHDLELIQKADWIVELGPGAGRRGGSLIAQGNPQTIEKTKDSKIGPFLNAPHTLPIPKTRRTVKRQSLLITGCSEHTLKKIDVEFPLERLVVVTGVSGSGKSTLVHKTLYPALAKIFDPTAVKIPDAGKFERFYGAQYLTGVTLLDQKPIGKSSRSNPATYLKAWDEIRKIFANQVLSMRRGYTPQYFSFNVEGGRCPVCKGEGEVTLDMHFMAEVKLPCEECQGKRFKKPILDIYYRNKNIFQILQMTIDEAYDLFRDNLTLSKKLNLLREVGLGYLQLGQSGTTLSGGESQRLKIAAALDQQSLRRKATRSSIRNRAERMLYIFDEPTTGLHHEDIRKLMLVIEDLIEAHQSVILIEHHPDVIAQADWVIDLGPGGGDQGGEVVARGTPEDLAKNRKSLTGKMLKEILFQQERPQHNNASQ